MFMRQIYGYMVCFVPFREVQSTFTMFDIPHKDKQIINISCSFLCTQTNASSSFGSK